MALLIDGVFVDISFNIAGKEHLKQKVFDLMKTDFNGESYVIHTEQLASMHIPSRMVTRHANMEQLQYQIGIAFMFCTEIIPMTKQLSLKEQQLLNHGL